MGLSREEILDNIKADRKRELVIVGKLYNERANSLAFAGFAIIWIFHTNTNERIGLPEELTTASLWISLYFAFNFIYSVLTIIAWHVVKEDKLADNLTGVRKHNLATVFFNHSERSEETGNYYHTRGSWANFYLKTTFLIVGYVYIFSFLISNLNV